jgi:hypothetical protein
MEEIRTSSWAEFVKAVESVRGKYGTFRRYVDDDTMYERPNDILFRGQADASWDLLTTLERKTNEAFDVSEYVHKALLTKSEVESFGNRQWHLPSIPEALTEIKEKQDVFQVHLPAYDYLVHLRHHGFPSPLLDWSESPYIAAFFAYAECKHADPAVYCYIERPDSVKGGMGGAPMISVQGPFVSTHKRHFAQKAWYTIATRWDYHLERHVFCSHRSVFDNVNPLLKQDILVKITLSASARHQALRALSDYNINHFTLFQSEDALIKALEYKFFDQRVESTTVVEG